MDGKVNAAGRSLQTEVGSKNPGLRRAQGRKDVQGDGEDWKEKNLRREDTTSRTYQRKK